MCFVAFKKKRYSCMYVRFCIAAAATRPFQDYNKHVCDVPTIGRYFVVSVRGMVVHVASAEPVKKTCHS